MIWPGKVFKVLTKVAGKERQGKEYDGDYRTLLHRLILVCRYRVEDEINHALSRALQLGQCISDQEAVIKNISKIDVSCRCDDDAMTRVRISGC